jgi:hypothetical protein
VQHEKLTSVNIGGQSVLVNIRPIKTRMVVNTGDQLQLGKEQEGAALEREGSHCRSGVLWFLCLALAVAASLGLAWYRSIFSL